jgi:hypothetical protein
MISVDLEAAPTLGIRLDAIPRNRAGYSFIQGIITAEIDRYEGTERVEIAFDFGKADQDKLLEFLLANRPDARGSEEEAEVRELPTQISQM